MRVLLARHRGRRRRPAPQPQGRLAPPVLRPGLPTGRLPPSPRRRPRVDSIPAIRRPRPQPSGRRGGGASRRLITQRDGWPQAGGSVFNRWKGVSFRPALTAGRPRPSSPPLRGGVPPLGTTRSARRTGGVTSCSRRPGAAPRGPARRAPTPSAPSTRRRRHRAALAPGLLWRVPATHTHVPVSDRCAPQVGWRPGSHGTLRQQDQVVADHGDHGVGDRAGGHQAGHTTLHGP